MSINSTQFVWPTSFACTVFYEKQIIPNSFNINISISPYEDKKSTFGDGFKKIKYFIENFLHNSVFINQENPLLQNFSSIETNLVLFPDEPYDFYVGCILFKKLITITQDYFEIDLLSIDSIAGDHIQYTILTPEECGLDLEGNFWWNDDTVSTGIDNSKDWKDLNLPNQSKFEPKIIKGGLSED